MGEFGSFVVENDPTIVFVLTYSVRGPGSHTPATRVLIIKE